MYLTKRGVASVIILSIITLGSDLFISDYH